MKLAAAIATAAALIATGTIYPTTMRVASIHDGIALVKTATGYAYEIDAEDYMEDELVSAIMFDNGTPEVTDDIILSTQYAGIF